MVLLRIKNRITTRGTGGVFFTAPPFQRMTRTRARTGKLFNYASAFGAFLLWGGWAYYVNGPGTPAGILSGVTQGTFSFLMTLVLVYLVAYLRGYFSTSGARLLLPPLLTVTATTGLLVLVHLSVHTPQLLATVVPAATIALVFTFVTSYKLHQAGENNE